MRLRQIAISTLLLSTMGCTHFTHALRGKTDGTVLFDYVHTKGNQTYYGMAFSPLHNERIFDLRFPVTKAQADSLDNFFEKGDKVFIDELMYHHNQTQALSKGSSIYLPLRALNN